MDTKDIRNIQEAYLEVYSVDEELTGPRKERAQQLLRSKMTASGRAKSGQKQNIDQLMRVTSIRGDFRKNKPPIEGSGNKSKRRRGIDVPDTRKEQVDLYDIILSHLLDEGYADTEQAAEAIMVNMSEEWRETIIEAEKSVEPDPFGRPGGKYGGVRKGGGYDRGYQAMKKKIKELEDKK